MMITDEQLGREDVVRLVPMRVAKAARVQVLAGADFELSRGETLATACGNSRRLESAGVVIFVEENGHGPGAPGLKNDTSQPQSNDEGAARKTGSLARAEALKGSSSTRDNCLAPNCYRHPCDASGVDALRALSSDVTRAGRQV